MLQYLINHWWMLLIRGLSAIAFGVLAFVWPQLTLLVLVLLFAAHALIDGIAAIFLGVRLKRVTDAPIWGSMVLVGLVSIAAGIVAFVWPGITALAALYVIAIWAILRGVLEISAAIRLRHAIENEWFLGLAGLTSILLGVLLFAWPAAGLMSLIWLIGSLAIVFGVLEVLVAFRLRRLKSNVSASTPMTQAPA